MSDDEYGDYEPLGEAPLEEGAEPGEVEDETGLGLDEDAAGTDDEEEELPEDAVPEAEDEEPTEPGAASAKASPQGPKVDPILRMSNKPCAVRVVPPDERITDNRLHKSEAAFVIAMRAKQIAKYGKSFVEAPGLYDPVAIAFKELFERRTPLTLRRQVGTGPTGDTIVEEWNVREMSYPDLTPPVPLGGSTAARGGRPF